MTTGAITIESTQLDAAGQIVACVARIDNTLEGIHERHEVLIPGDLEESLYAPTWPERLLPALFTAIRTEAEREVREMLDAYEADRGAN